MRAPRFVHSLGSRTVLAVAMALLLPIVTLSAPAGAAEQKPPINILMVASWNKDMLFQAAFDAGLQAALKEAGRRYNLFEEYVDAGRFDAQSQRVLMLDTLQQKYKEKKFDVIVAESAPAVRLFADDPGLFPGVRRIYVQTGARVDGRNTGETIAVGADFEGAIAEMVRLVQPRKIYVLADPNNGPGGPRVLGRLKKAVAAEAAGLETEYLVDLSVAEMRDRVSALPPHSAIFMLPIFNSLGKARYTPRRSAALIAEKANAPIFTAIEGPIGTGIVGGYVLSTERVGRIAAQKILGADPSALISPNAVYYDWRVLKRFGISESRVPAGATLLYRQPTVFEEYRWQILSTIGVVAVLSVLSAFLMVNVFRRRRAERALIRANEHLEDKVRERTHELSEANDRAEEANRAKSAFLASMSHEIRTPLNAVIGYSEMVLEELEEDGNDDLADDVKRILNSGQHLLSLINDILDLSKIEAGKMELFAEDIVLSDLFDEVTATAQGLVEKNGNRLVIEIAPDTSKTIRNDPLRVRQILLNLLSNAAKFTMQGTITLSATMTGEDGAPMLRLAVADTGMGMSPDQLEHLFEEFSQVNSAATRKIEGTGLGLSICRRLAEMMGGRIEATSALGEGTTSSVTVPELVGEPVAHAIQAPAEAAIGGDGAASRMVLVIDDAAEARDILARYLTQEGFQVATAGGGVEGLELARKLLPDAITLDVIMEDKPGWDVLTELKGDPKTKDIPVIMCSIVDDERKAIALGAVEHLVKPISRERLVSLISNHFVQPNGNYALVVDDEEDSRNLIAAAAQRLFQDVATAANGRDALEILEARGAPAGILLDLVMPEMDGFEFLHEIRSREAFKSTPVVIVTSKDLSAGEKSFLNSTSSRIIDKEGDDLAVTLGNIGESLREVCAGPTGGGPDLTLH